MNRAQKLKLQASDLPNGYRSPLARMLPREHTQFPEDRAHMDAQNRKELFAKGGVFRRAVREVLGESFEVEYTTRRLA